MSTSATQTDLKPMCKKFNNCLTAFYVPYVLIDLLIDLLIDVPSNWFLKFTDAGYCVLPRSHYPLGE